MKPKSPNCPTRRPLRKAKVAADIPREEEKVFERRELTPRDTLDELRRIIHFDPAAIFNENGCTLPIPSGRPRSAPASPASR
jgi:hypothetical protein